MDLWIAAIDSFEKHANNYIIEMNKEPNTDINKIINFFKENWDHGYTNLDKG